ncbi:hypothetical protein ACOSQ3_004452 [Xanthoceras sorbifolium]
MGFRNLSIFNRALFAKQCWRLVMYPFSLAARVLKSKYFANCNFQVTKARGADSFLWKSLIWGKVIFYAGSRWRVGNGRMVQIYKDRWLPRPSSFRPFSPPVLSLFATVDVLKSVTGGWNELLVKLAFHPDDAALILSIPPSSVSVDDSMIWHFEEKGVYTVKSGY